MRPVLSMPGSAYYAIAKVNSHMAISCT